MSFIFAIAIILILSISISYIFQKKIEYTLPMTMAGVSLILYIASFLSLRTISIYAIAILSLIAIAFLVYKLFRSSKKIVSIIKSPGLIFFVIICACIAYISRGFVFSTWDEFSHWGLVIKNMYLTNDFANIGNSTVLFKWYPPGISLFLNFTTSLSNHFSEASALAGMLALSYSQMAIIFTKIKFSDWKKNLLLTSTILIAPLVFFGSFYSTIYVDAIMGLIFVNILFFSCSYEKRDLFYGIYMALQFYLLVNTKQIGIGLAAIALVAIVIDIIARNKLQPIKALFSKLKGSIIYISLPLLSAVLTYASWKLHIKANNISEGFSNPSLQKLIDLFGPNAPGYKHETITNFVNYFFENQQYGSLFLSPFLWSMLCLVIMYGIYKIGSIHKTRGFSIQLSVIIGFYLYSCLILIMYLTGFDKYEATRLASVERYLGSYLISLFMLTVFIAMEYLCKPANKERGRLNGNIKIAAIAIFVFTLVPTSSILDSTVFQTSSANAKQAIRSPYGNIEKYRNIIKSEKDKVFIISQNDKGLDYYLLRYAFTPIQTQGQPSANEQVMWSLGKPYYDGDIWTADISIKQWSDYLENYSYVYLHEVDARFIQDYGQLFENSSEIKNTSLYKIEKNSDNIVLKLTEADGAATK